MNTFIGSIIRRIIWLLYLVVTGVSTAAGHAFLEHADPAVGSEVKTVPTVVRIRFSEAVEAAFSSIKVFDASGKEVDKKDGHADPQDNRVFIVSLTRLTGQGSYKVSWRAVSVDTHVTTGDFTFRVEP